MRLHRQSIAVFLGNRPEWRILLLLGLCVLVAMLVSFGVLQPSLMRMLRVAEAAMRLYPTAGPLAFIGFAAISAMFAFVSTAVLVPLAVLTWGAELPYALSTVYLGQGLVEQRSGLILAVGVVVSVLSLTATRVLRTRLRDSDAEVRAASQRTTDRHAM